MLLIRILLCVICLFLLYVLYSSTKANEGFEVPMPGHDGAGTNPKSDPFKKHSTPTPTPTPSPSPGIPSSDDVISNLKVNAENGNVNVTGTITNKNGDITKVEVTGPNGSLIKTIPVNNDKIDFIVPHTELGDVKQLADNMPVTLHFIPINNTGLMLSEKKEISFARNLLAPAPAPALTPVSAPTSAPAPAPSPDDSSSGSDSYSPEGSGFSGNSSGPSTSPQGSSSTNPSSFEPSNKMDGLLMQKIQEIDKLKEELEKLQNMTCIPKPKKDAIDVVKSQNNMPTIRTHYQKFYKK